MSSLALKKARKEGYFIEFEGKALSSTVDPINQSRRLMERVSADKQSVVLCLGMNALYFPFHLCERVEKVLVVEPRFSLKELLLLFPDELKTLRTYLERGKVVFIESIENFGQVILNETLSTLKIVDHLEGHFGDWKGRFMRVIEARVKSSITTQYFERTWLRNALSNLKNSNYQSITRLKIPVNRRALLISSGFELEKSLEKVKKNRDSFCLFALASVLPLLGTVGVTPDFVISSDGGFYNDGHFRFSQKHLRNIPLIAPLSLCYHIPRHYGGVVYFYLDEESILEALLKDASFSLMEKEGIAYSYLPMDASISISFLYLARYLGYNVVYTSGVDFSIEPFKYHCLGNSTEEDFFQRGKRLASFETLFFNLYYTQKLLPLKQAWTTSTLSLYREQFERVASSLHLKIKKIGQWMGDIEEAFSSPNRLALSPHAEEKIKNRAFEFFLERYRESLVKLRREDALLALLYTAKWD